MSAFYVIDLTGNRDYKLPNCSSDGVEMILVNEIVRPFLSNPQTSNSFGIEYD